MALSLKEAGKICPHRQSSCCWLSGIFGMYRLYGKSLVVHVRSIKCCEDRTRGYCNLLFAELKYYTDSSNLNSDVVVGAYRASLANIGLHVDAKVEQSNLVLDLPLDLNRFYTS